LTLTVLVNDILAPYDDQQQSFKKCRQAADNESAGKKEQQNTSINKSDTSSDVSCTERLKRKRHLHDNDFYCLNKINEKSTISTTCDLNTIQQSNQNQENPEIVVKLSTFPPDKPPLQNSLNSPKDPVNKASLLNSQSSEYCHMFV